MAGDATNMVMYHKFVKEWKTGNNTASNVEGFREMHKLCASKHTYFFNNRFNNIIAITKIIPCEKLIEIGKKHSMKGG